MKKYIKPNLDIETLNIDDVICLSLDGTDKAPGGDIIDFDDFMKQN